LAVVEAMREVILGAIIRAAIARDLCMCEEG